MSMIEDGPDTFKQAQENVFHFLRTTENKNPCISDVLTHYNINEENFLEELKKELEKYNKAQQLRVYWPFFEATVDEYCKGKITKSVAHQNNQKIWAEIAKVIKTQCARSLVYFIDQLNIKTKFMDDDDDDGIKSITHGTKKESSLGTAPDIKSLAPHQLKPFIPELCDFSGFVTKVNRYLNDHHWPHIQKIDPPTGLDIPNEFFEWKKEKKVEPFVFPDLKGHFRVTDKFVSIKLLGKEYYYFGQFDFKKNIPCGVGILLAKEPQRFWEYDHLYAVLGYIGRPGAFCFENRVFCSLNEDKQASRFRERSEEEKKARPLLKKGNQIIDYGRKAQRKVYQAPRVETMTNDDN